MIDTKLGYGNIIDRYRQGTKKPPAGSWTFVCKRCKTIKEMRGRKVWKGKYVCAACHNEVSEPKGEAND